MAEIVCANPIWIYEPEEGEVLLCMWCNKPIKESQVGIGRTGGELRGICWIHETPCFGACKSDRILYERALARERVLYGQPQQAVMF